MRNWPIARKLAAVLAVPIIVMIVLAALQSAAAFGRAAAADRTQQFARFEVSVDNLVTRLQDETSSTTMVTGQGYTSGQDQLAEARTRTNAARAVVIAGASRLDLDGEAPLRAAVSTALTNLRDVDVLRARVDDHELGRGAGYESYDPIISALLDVASTSIGVGSGNLAVLRGELAAASISQAKQAGTLERGNVAAILFLRQTTPAVAAAVRTTGGAKAAWITQFRDAATATQWAAYQRLVGSISATADTLRTRILTEVEAAQPVDVPPLTFWTPSGQVDTGFRSLEQQMTTNLETTAGNVAHDARRSAWLLTALVAAAVALSIAAAALVAISMVRQVVAARRAVLDAANHRLPRVMAKLGTGEPISDGASAVPATVMTRDEVGQLAGAANDLYLAAVASGRSALASRTMSAQIVSVGRRVRGMVDRNIALLDGLERWEIDPDRLRQLFALDSLAAQQRRFVAALFVLAGEVSEHAERPAADLLEVTRGAASEVNDYQRVEIVLAGAEAPRLRGSAVADVTHLLAELIANATAFSPPETPVKVRTERAYQGCALLVEDRGPGLPPETLEELNQRLADPDPDAVFSVEQLGLAVVARLARRHGISVRLRESAYLGVDAIVLLPAAIFEAGAPTATAPMDVTAIPAPRRVPRRKGLARAALGELPPAPPNGPALRNETPSPPDAGQVPAGAPVPRPYDEPAARRDLPPRYDEQPGRGDTLAPRPDEQPALVPAGISGVARHRPARPASRLPRRRRGAHLAPELSGRRPGTEPGLPPAPDGQKTVGQFMADFEDSWQAGVASALRATDRKGNGHE
jgi:signal transduction histidine kinase